MLFSLETFHDGEEIVQRHCEPDDETLELDFPNCIWDVIIFCGPCGTFR